MEKEQGLEWLEAQKIVISEDLVSVAKRQLDFLAAVDRRRWLYDGPLLDRAIYRYKACWLPLLAKHTESGVVEGSLVVPLDCEWIWHCHRLNPVQYRKDCEEVYGRILGNQNVESSVQGKSKHQTAEKWDKLYPDEPFELDASNPSSGKNADMYVEAVESITYDLVSAAKRQSSFYYQVSRASMHEDCFLKAAVARYKGFLHLIRRNLERSMKRFCVPTYDIDLIWHSHQLHPLSYCNDMVELLGRVLEHDDTDADRTKGKKLDVGFYETSKQWEDTYGLRYWRAGAMYRGNLPSPLVETPYLSNYGTKNEIISQKSQNYLPLPQTMVVEVLLEIVGIRNLPASHQNRSLFVSFSKKQRDLFFTGSCTLSIFSESGEKQVAGFKCEPTGELTLTLMSNSTSNVSSSKAAKIIGTTSISLQDLTNPESNLSVENWFELKPHFGHVDSKPVCLHVAASSTVPVRAPHVFHVVRSCPFSANTCFFPLLGRTQQIKSWTRFMDDNRNEVISVRMRNYKKTEEGNNSVFKKEVIGETKLSRKPCLLAEYAENKWSLNDSNLSFGIEKITNQHGHILELNGEHQIKLFLGKKLEYEPKNCKERTDHNFITVVEFCAENPYGKAIALFDVKSESIEVSEEWFVLPGIVLAFILSDMLKKEGYSSLIACEKNVKERSNSNLEVNKQNSNDKIVNSSLAMDTSMTGTGSAPMPSKSSGGGAAEKAGGCGSGCGGSCGDALSGENSGGCGGGCGGGCSGGCGGGCGSATKSTGCGGCGGGCGGGCASLKAEVTSHKDAVCA